MRMLEATCPGIIYLINLNTSVKQMSNAGTWCDNVIVQVVANSHNYVIHITESDFNKSDGTIIYPASTAYHEKKQT